jgi:NADP-dependent aldehyde dehydrogenase
MIDGSILIGAQTRQHDGGFHAVNPATGDQFGPKVSEATVEDVAEAAALAAAAYPVFAGLAPSARRLSSTAWRMKSWRSAMC